MVTLILSDGGENIAFRRFFGLKIEMFLEQRRNCVCVTCVHWDGFGCFQRSFFQPSRQLMMSLLSANSRYGQG